MSQQDRSLRTASFLGQQRQKTDRQRGADKRQACRDEIKKHLDNERLRLAILRANREDLEYLGSPEEIRDTNRDILETRRQIHRTRLLLEKFDRYPSLYLEIFYEVFPNRERNTPGEPSVEGHRHPGGAQQMPYRPAILSKPQSSADGQDTEQKAFDRLAALACSTAIRKDFS